MYDKIVAEASNYFGLPPQTIPHVFESYMDSFGVRMINPDLGYVIPTDGAGMDVLLWVVVRAFGLLGARMDENQKARWLQNPQTLRTGVHPVHIRKLKVKVKKMSLVWKAEGQVFDSKTSMNVILGI